MTQIRPEACTCHHLPNWCAPCVESGWFMPPHDRLIQMAVRNVELLRENLALRALVRRFAPDDPANAAPDPLPWEDPAPDPDVPTKAGPFRVEHRLGWCADPAPEPDAPTKAGPFPANALRHADGGRVRLGAYAPTLPP